MFPPGAFASGSVGNGQLYYPRNNNLIVYETITIPLPVYVNLSYSITLKAEYQQQINEMLTPFLVKTGQINQFIMYNDGHRFEGFLPKEFGANNNIAELGEEERTFETKFDIRPKINESVTGLSAGEQTYPVVFIKNN